jgi:ABC-type Zn uptake system ZnuABC Zn-binding protein ZnuA
MSNAQSDLKNAAVRDYSFLKDLYEDDYFPKPVVDKVKDVLVSLCFELEDKQPKSLDELYAITQAATDQINDLQTEFEENDSDIDTVARECIGGDFEFIATAYGFKDADIEELIATRDW